MTPPLSPTRRLWLSLRLYALGWAMLWVVIVVAGVGRHGRAAQPAALAAEVPAELTAAARDYRIEIYGAFRTNRAEYDQRRKQAEALLAEWQARGALPAEAAVLVRWLDDARRAAARQQPAPLPPRWNSAAESVPLSPRTPSLPLSKSVPLLRALPQNRTRLTNQVRLSALSLNLLWPQESNPRQEVIAVQPEDSSLAVVLAWQDSQHAEQGSSAGLAKQDLAPLISISSNPLALPAAKLNPNTLTNNTTPPVDDESAELNTAELRARLRGYDKAWRALQADLYSDEELTLDRAAALLMILDDLAQARRDLTLYQAIAPAALRDEIRGLPLLDELHKQLRQIIATARTNAISDLNRSPGERATLDRAWLLLLDRAKP